MVFERNRWVRRLLVAQPALLWPVSFVLWSTNNDYNLVLAVALVWLSACASVMAILRPMYRNYSDDLHNTCRRDPTPAST